MSIEDISTRLLYGGSTYIPELDPELQENRDQIAINDYETYLLENSIGTENFEYIFYVFINSIKQQEMDDRKDTIRRILEKVVEFYDFNFSTEVNINDENVHTQIFDFIKFIEFDNIEFFTDLWRNIKVNPFEMGEDFFEKKYFEISLSIDSMVEVYTYNKFITEFLRTYNKHGLINWIRNKTNLNKTEILTELLLEEE